MTFLTRNFDPLTPLASKFLNFAVQILLFLHETHCCRRHTCTCATKFLHHLGTGCCLPKTTFMTKIGRGLGQGSIQKMWDPLRISATVKASNFKFGTQLWFGEYVTITTLVPNLVGAGCATGAPQKLWVSRTPYHVPCITQQLHKCNKTANINVKKLRFRHELMANDISKTATITKRWYYSGAHWHLGDLLVGNHLFVIFAVLDLSFAVNSCLNRSFFYITGCAVAPALC